ncbi:MAG: matrixin family metalloprotease [Myxococcota bacterium]|nr:matrixin family metalloprotease [Myxococcota bacterium]
MRKSVVAPSLACALLAALALPSPASAYVVKRTSGGKRVRWSADRVGVHLHRSVTRDLDAARAHEAARIAAEAWSEAGGPRLEVVPGMGDGPYRAGAPGTEVRLLSEWPHAPRLLAVTVTSYDDTSGQILDADILLNGDEHELAFLDGDDDEGEHFDLGALLSHEAGHVLGLGETDADPMATMWPRIGRGDTHQRSIAEDDAAGIGEAYRDAVLGPASGCSGNRVSARTERGLLPWLLAALAIGFLGWLSWRRRNEEGARRRGGARGAPASAAGLMFGGAVFLLSVPGAGPSGASEPVAVRAARAYAALSRPVVEREAMLAAAADDEEPEVRRAAVRAIANAPVRDDLGVMERLADDADGSVSGEALAALEAVRRAAPSAAVDWERADPGRRAPFEVGTREGHADRVAVEQDADGLIHTRYEVDGVTVRVPGGCLDGVCQQVGEATRPVDGERLLVSPATGAWARFDGARAWGGWLGDGPALRLP